MKTVFVDANVFVRFFAADDTDHQALATELFRKAASGKVSLVTGPPVLFEIAWTLRSAYGQSPEKILTVLEVIASLPGLRLLDLNLVEQAIALARRSGQEFADAYIAVSAQRAGAAEIATFNQKHFQEMDASLFRF